MTIAYRDVEPGDEQFVVSTWSRAYKRSRQAGIIASSDWEDVMHPQIRRLLRRSTVRTIVAFEGDDPNFLYGWICGEASGRVPVVHFTYVKDSYRRWKDVHVGTALFAALGVDPRRFFYFTCWTPILLELAALERRNPIPRAKHDANFARYDNYEPDEAPWRR